MEAERRSTLASLKGQLADVGSSVKAMRTTVVVGSVLTVACLAAVFGVTLLANEASKESHVQSGMLVDRSGKVVNGATVEVNPFTYKAGSGPELKTFTATMPDGTVVTSEVISFVDTGAYKQYTTREFIATIIAGSNQAMIIPSGAQGEAVFAPIFANMGGKESFKQMTEEEMDEAATKARKLQKYSPNRGTPQNLGCGTGEVGSRAESIINGMRINTARTNSAIGQTIGRLFGGDGTTRFSGRITGVGMIYNGSKAVNAFINNDVAEGLKALAALGIDMAMGAITYGVIAACGATVVCGAIAFTVVVGGTTLANMAAGEIIDYACALAEEQMWEENCQPENNPCPACGGPVDLAPEDCDWSGPTDHSQFGASYGTSYGYGFDSMSTGYVSNYSGAQSFGTGVDYGSVTGGYCSESDFQTFLMWDMWAQACGRK